MKARHFQLSSARQFVPLQRKLAKQFAGVADDTLPTADISLYDTFDGRLYQKGQALVLDGGTLGVIDLKTGQSLAAMTISDTAPPRFWWDYPMGPVRELLSDNAGIRAVLPLLFAKKSTTVLALLNSDEKTVCRLRLEALTVDSADPLFSVSVNPVRGYREAAAAAAAVAKGESATPLPHHPIVAALESMSPAPDRYQAKPLLPLTPDMSADTAVRMILRHLAGVMRQNEKGIEADLDTEFLHDFRVAVRRSRSLLTLAKGVVPSEVSAILKSDLRAAGQATNAQRDMDVYLLDQDVYESLLPPRLKASIEPLFATLRRRRSVALKKTRQYLDSTAYRQALDHIDHYTKQDTVDPTEAPSAAIPVVALARNAITARYGKIVKSGRRIEDDTPDAKIHRLRIECKKLRYALEFFSPLFPPSEMAILIKQLKILQDHLGRFNDLAVQQEFLGNYLDRLKPTTGTAIGTAAATGALIGILHREQRALRKGFSSAFEAFDSADNASRYERLEGKEESSL